MPLTELKCKNAKPKEKPYKLADGGGLYLEVMSNGSKYWRMKYRHVGKEKRLALGVYPAVSLAEAREGRDGSKKLLSAGTDPTFAKKENRRQRALKAAHSFEAVAHEWHNNRKDHWSTNYAENVLKRLEADIFPAIGFRPISEISPMEMLEVIQKIEKRGAHEIAKRMLQTCGQVFKYAIVTGRADRNPSADIGGALKPVKHTHFAALEAKELPEFLNALEQNDARLYQQTRHAISGKCRRCTRPPTNFINFSQSTIFCLS